jgi:protein-tyrosine phosphatase
MDPIKGLGILWQRLTRQGFRTTALWAADHAVRIVTGAPIRRLCQITPHLYVGGQYRRRGLPKLRSWGISAVVDLRREFDDSQAGIAPARYLYLATTDDQAPTLEQLKAGADFIAQEIEQGGSVYVHCGSGVGRAPTMAAAYLIRGGLTVDQAWAKIRAARPQVRPTPPQLERIRHFANEVPRTLSDEQE